MLQRADAAVCGDRRVTPRHLALGLSVSRVSVTSFNIVHIRRLARDGFIGATQSRTKPTERQILHGFLARVKPEGQAVVAFGCFCA